MADKTRHLYLIPSTLGDSLITHVIPPFNLDVIQTLSHFVVEEERTARRFLIRCGYKHDINSIHFYTLNEHTSRHEVPSIFTDSGSSDLGLISEAGVPAVADPGALLIEEAFRLKFRIVPLTGPSSIILALMASGMNGQQFAFNGYLPIKGPERIARIRFYEKRSEAEKQSQLFIEAPYRNNQLIGAFLSGCKPGTRLCIAANLTLADEWIRTMTIHEWKQSPPPDLKRIPAVFILQA
jgi:16S rRNA (cytidine1402-2'-O)-methyltransferase